MADIPVPRSYPQIYGEELETFLSRTGLPSVLVGSPVRSLLSASAQSDLRATQDVFGALAVGDLERTRGQALDRTGEQEGVRRQLDTPSSGVVTVGDSSFAKKSTKVYGGQPAPIVGSTSVYVQDASAFPASGSLYLGRGTTNYEGPVAYSAKTNLGTYWRLDLSTGTTRFHNSNEPVVLAQGGNRQIPAGSIVQTAQGNIQSAVKFTVLHPATLPDGEVSLGGITVIAQKPGLTGNVVAGSIVSFSSPPFVGATATNPLPFVNATGTWDDATYRDAIRTARATRARGTDLAVEDSVIGMTSPDEAKVVTSSSLVHRVGQQTVLYIDDGTGYEEQSTGVALEVAVDSALGGEQDFEVSAAGPITKAHLVATQVAPFALRSGDVLAVKVGGFLYQHTFDVSEFVDISAATAPEVAASINSDASSTFSARLVQNATSVALVARQDTDEDLEVVAAGADELDANVALGFPAGRQYTLRLYKNDRLLNKDGQRALVSSEPQSSWVPFTGSQTLTVAVDGTTAVTYTFADADFVAARTGYATLNSANSLVSWAAVVNAKVPGITATMNAGTLELTSNLGPSSRAAVEITGGTLVSGGKVFTFNTAAGLVSEGAANDYQLSRSGGQFRLTSALSAGDRLTLGTTSGRAFLEGSALGVVTLASDAQLWFALDGGAALVSTGLTGSSSVTFSEYVATPAVTWGKRVRVTAGSGTPFTTLAVGDWAIFLDTGLNAANRGTWRVAYVDTGSTYFEIEKSAVTAETVTLSGGGIAFVRTPARLQAVTVPAASNYTAASFADAIPLPGGSVSAYRNTRIRVRTNTAGPNGDVGLVAENAAAAGLGLSVGDAIANLDDRAASVESADQAGTPNFFNASTTISTVSSGTDFVVSSGTGWDAGMLAHWRRAVPDPDLGVLRSRYGTDWGLNTNIASIATNSFSVREAALQEFLPAARVIGLAPPAIGPNDDLAVVVDGDESQRRYAPHLYRRLQPVGSTYGLTNTFTDTDAAGASLAVGFGLTFDFRDFAALMRARAKSHSESGDTTKTVLWRYGRFGPEGNYAEVRYTYPPAASTGVQVVADPANAALSLWGNVLVGVQLPSGAARTAYTVRNSTRVGVFAATSGSLQVLTYCLGFSVSSATRRVVLAYTARNTTAFTGTVTGGTSGATGTVVSDSLAGGGSGAGTLRLSSVTGTFTVGETITAGAASATSSGGQTGETTLTLDVATPGATDHGFAVSNSIYLNSTSGSYTSGLYSVTARTTTTITYTEGTTSAATTANIGDVSYDVGRATLNGSTVAVNDIAVVGPGSSLPAGYQAPLRIRTAMLGDQWWSGKAESANSTGTVVTWYALNSTANLSFFPINSSTNQAGQIATAVNALAAAANSTCPVTAVAVGSGGVATGQISQASFDEFSALGYAYALSDGVNWVKSNGSPSNVTQNYQLTFKSAVAAALATNSDWAAEEIRLVPGSAAGLVRYLGVTAVSGLGTAAEISASSHHARVQLRSLTAGSSGSIQVQGGLGNSASASVLGSAQNLGSSTMLVSCRTSDCQGLMGGMWVDVQNAAPMPKVTFTPSTSASSIDVSGNFTLSGTQAWTYANTGAAQINARTWLVEPVGRYTAFKWVDASSAPDLSGIAEGDWVVVARSSYTISSRNTGTFRVVRVSDTEHAFWVENPNSAEEVVTASLWFLTYDSVMPGDTIQIGTSLWGAGNVGTWTVESIDSADTHKFKVSVASGPTAAFTGPVALGSQSGLVQCFEGAATKLVKQVQSLSPNPLDGSLQDVKFTTYRGYRNVGAVAGSVVRALDKLAFPTALAAGVDGYGHSTGLIGEAVRVLYGDRRDPAAYPGVAAANASIDVSGPFIRGVACSLAVRLRSTASSADVIEKVKSAVAAAVNRAGVGQPVAISSVVDAASSVNGVVAVTVLSPQYSAGHDLIGVQPNEKALVLSLDDVSVSLVGV